MSDKSIQQMIIDIKSLLNIPLDMSFIHILSPIIFPLVYLYIYSQSRKSFLTNQIRSILISFFSIYDNLLFIFPSFFKYFYNITVTPFEYISTIYNILNLDL